MNAAWLFEHSGKRIGVRDFERALKRLPIKKGDTLFVHAGLRAFGELAPGYTKAGLCRPLIKTLKKSIGKSGTLVMPTYTYVFCKRRVFDIKKTPSEVGALGEFFRKEKGVVRSEHPIFSVAAQGPGAKRMTDVDMDSFGPNSSLARLCDDRGVVLFFGGAPFSTGTLYHLLEQERGVPYRFMKKFPGVIVRGTKKYKAEATFFVRRLRQRVENDVSGLEQVLRKKGMLREAPVGASRLMAVRAKDFCREGMRLLERDIYALAEKSRGKPILRRR